MLHSANKKEIVNDDNNDNNNNNKKKKKVILSECINGSDDFHLECYRKFTAASEKQHKQIKSDNEAENKKRRSSIERLMRSEMISLTLS